MYIDGSALHYVPSQLLLFSYHKDYHFIPSQNPTRAHRSYGVGVIYTVAVDIYINIYYIPTTRVSSGFRNNRTLCCIRACGRVHFR